MAKKTTSAERKAFIEERRARLQASGGKESYPRDMSFIDRLENIIRPNKKDYESARRRMHYDSSRTYETREENNRYHKYNGLAQEFSMAISLCGLIGGLFFLSPNVTGNVIANMTNSTTNSTGMILILIGLVAGFFWIKK